MRLPGRDRSSPEPAPARPPVAGPAFVLGNGPSLRGVDLHRFEGTTTIGMNAAYREWERVGFYPTHYCCLDEELVTSHARAIAALLEDGRVESAFLTGRILELEPELADDDRCLFFESFRDGERMERRRRDFGLPRWSAPAFETAAPAKVTTGAYAVRYAIHLGHARVYLLGIDCNYVESLPAASEAGGIALKMDSTPEQNPNYFFDDYQREGDRFNQPNPEVHGGNLHLQAVEAVRDDLAARGLRTEIFNLSPASLLEAEGVLPLADLDAALESAGR